MRRVGRAVPSVAVLRGRLKMIQTTIFRDVILFSISLLCCTCNDGPGIRSVVKY